MTTLYGIALIMGNTTSFFLNKSYETATFYLSEICTVIERDILKGLSQIAGGLGYVLLLIENMNVSGRLLYFLLEEES